MVAVLVEIATGGFNSVEAMMAMTCSENRASPNAASTTVHKSERAEEVGCSGSETSKV